LANRNIIRKSGSAAGIISCRIRLRSLTSDVTDWRRHCKRIPNLMGQSIW